MSFESIKIFFKTHKAPIGTLLIIIAYIIATFLIYKYNTFKIFDNYSKWMNSIFVVGLFLGLLLFFKQTNASIRGSEQVKWSVQLWNLSKPLLTILIGLLFVFGMLYLISSIDALSYLMTYVFFIGAIIGGLHLLYQLVSNTPQYKETKDHPFTKMIYHLLFYIPCSIVRLIQGIIHSSEKTPKFVYQILIAEVIFIFGYFLLPPLFDYIYTHDAIILLQEPVFLDFQKSLGTYEFLKQSDVFKYSYGLSFWTFIDQNLPNLTNSSVIDATILHYGNNPNITYNVKKELLKIFIKDGIDGTRKIYETTNFPLQKWNNFVINYTNGVMDIFLNGKLVATDKHAVSYMTLDNVTCGLENGLQGGIKNVMYFKEPLTKYKIQTLYKRYR